LRLSILIPVYDERTVVERSLAQVLAAPLPENMDRELIIVDDYSTDGTAGILDRMASVEPSIRPISKSVNQGKAAAARTPIEHASGDFCLVQDADLEYDPSDIPIRSDRFGFERGISMNGAKPGAFSAACIERWDIGVASARWS
jgi:glycosyltransferase involved in cell wall biosynthesis